METKSYNRQQLAAFIESDFYKKLEHIPISHHRAISHIQNPDCTEDDILLWATYENDQLVGYVGVLSGIYCVNNIEKKIYWLSCFWVDPSFRQLNVASQLFFPLIKRYKDQLILSNFIPSLEKTYQSLGVFQPTQVKTGTKFFLDFCFTNLIISRIPKIAFLKSVFEFAEKVGNSILPVRKLFFKEQKYRCQIDETFELDAEIQTFIDVFHTTKNFVKRDTTHIDWILAHPWVLEGKPDAASKRYYFTSVSNQFKYFTLKVTHNGKIVGFVILKQRDKELDVSYIYSFDDAINDIAVYLLDKVKTGKLKTIITFDDRLAKAVEMRRIHYILSKEMKRSYIISKNIELDVKLLHEGDGDTIFT